MRIKHLFFGFASMAMLASSLAAQELRTEPLTIRFFQVTAEIAQTPRERAKGLMGRQSLPPNHGMLFVFDSPATQCMWMRNTFIPLSVAFIDDRGRIVNIEDMKPRTEISHCSQQPVRFALEMERGWFSQRGLGPGATLRGIPGVAP